MDNPPQKESAAPRSEPEVTGFTLSIGFKEYPLYSLVSRVLRSIQGCEISTGGCEIGTAINLKFKNLSEPSKIIDLIIALRDGDYPIRVINKPDDTEATISFDLQPNKK